MTGNENTPDPNTKLWAGVALAAVASVAYIVLKLNGISEQGLFVLLVPLVTFLIIGGKLETENQKQNKVLAKIDHQTNGVLEGKIRRITAEVVSQEFDKRGL
jgi:hypothetical protein